MKRALFSCFCLCFYAVFAPAAEEYTDAVNSIDTMRDIVSEHRTNLDTIQADMDAFAAKYLEAYNALLKAQAA